MSLEWYEWNPFMFEKLSLLIKDDWVFADIGANLGEFTDFFKKFKYKEIYAFELNPVTAGILKNKHNQPNIIVENYAVCDKDGIVPFFNGGNPADDKTYNIIGFNMNLINTEKTGEVQSIRLDTYFKDKKIDLMKIDVEGAELMVLEGLKGIINNIKYILIECHLDSDWELLRNILLNNFYCTNFYNNEIITNTSPRPYQCFCKNRNDL